MSKLCKVGNSYFIRVPKIIVDKYRLTEIDFMTSYDAIQQAIISTPTIKYKNKLDIIIGYIAKAFGIDRNEALKYYEVYSSNLSNCNINHLKMNCDAICSIISMKCADQYDYKTVFLHFIPENLCEEKINCIYDYLEKRFK